MSIALSVNLNKIALLRNSRDGQTPSVLAFGEQALRLGAAGITVHPRPDQRHIRAADVPDLHDLVARYPGKEFNIEGNPLAAATGTYPGYLSLVELHTPHQCTLVPDSQDQLTSDHGFNLEKDGDQLEPIIRRIKSFGTRVSLFMDPDLNQIKLAKTLGADRIELYTGPFAEAHAESPVLGLKSFESYKGAAEYAHDIGLEVNAGHDLNLENMPLFRQLPHLAEVSIGHALTIDALNMGYEQAIKSYLALCQA